MLKYLHNYFSCETFLPSSFMIITAWKVSKYGVISGLYFPAFGLNTERHFVSLRIHSECGKIRTRNYSVFGHFSLSEFYRFMIFLFYFSNRFIVNDFSGHRTKNEVFRICDQICSFLQIWSHLLKKCLMKNFNFCTVSVWVI